MTLLAGLSPPDIRHCSTTGSSHMFLLALIIVNQLGESLGSSDEVALINKLFREKSYNELIRPARNLNDTIEVQFGVAMVQLITIDERNQIMKTNVWLRMSWPDYQLAWNPKNYGGLTVIRVEPAKVWQPDIVLFNNADGKYEVSFKSRILVYSNGVIAFIPPAIYASSCRIDVEFFPFDEQTCQLIFGSWTFNGDQVSLNYYEGYRHIDLSSYTFSGTWDIRECPANVTVTQPAGGAPRITRMVNLIIPCVLISFLNTSVFFLPADAAEKVALSISILLALVVFLLLLQKILPPTSIKIPLIANYLQFAFILNIISIVSTVVVINLSFRTPLTHSTHPWIRTVFLKYLPKLLFMRQLTDDEPSFVCLSAGKINASRGAANSTKHGSPNHHPPRRTGFRYGNDYSSDFFEFTNIHHPNCKIGRTLSDRRRMKKAQMEQMREMFEPKPVEMTPKLHCAVRQVRYIANHLKNEEAYARVLEDWKYIGLVVDRVLLIIFLVVTLGGTLGIFINNPHIFSRLDQAEIRDKILALKHKSAD